MRVAFVDALALGEAVLDPMARAIEELRLRSPPAPRERCTRPRSPARRSAVRCGRSPAESSRGVRPPEALADHLTFLVLAPYLGPRAAAEEIRAARAASG